MRHNRRFLYWGVFFLALGGITAGVQLGLVDEAAVLDALRWWPVVVVAIGFAIVVRRAPYSLGAWLVAASLPGLALGGAIEAGPRVSLDCASHDRPILAGQQGVFDGAATVDVTGACGSLDVMAAPGTSWAVETSDAGRATAAVTSSPSQLHVDAGTTGSWSLGSPARQTWLVTLPTSRIDELRLALSAGDGRIDLAGAHLGDVSIAGTATELRVDLSNASLVRLTASVDLGGLSIRLPDADLTGTLTANLGQIEVCLPANVGLRVQRTSDLGVVKYQGFEQRATEWQSPGYDQAPFHVDLTATPDLGGIEFNPIGGCR